MMRDRRSSCKPRARPKPPSPLSVITPSNDAYRHHKQRKEPASQEQVEQLTKFGLEGGKKIEICTCLAPTLLWLSAEEAAHKINIGLAKKSPL